MQADTASSPERPSLLTLQLAQTWSCSGSSEQTASLRRKPQAQKSLFFNQALSELEELLTVWTQTSTLVWMFLHPELSSRELPPLQHPQTQTCWSCPSPGALTAAFSEEKSLQKTILQKIGCNCLWQFPQSHCVPLQLLSKTRWHVLSLSPGGEAGAAFKVINTEKRIKNMSPMGWATPRYTSRTQNKHAPNNFAGLERR